MTDIDALTPGTASADARPYPPSWRADVVVADGGTVHLRPIEPSDAEALIAFHAALSDRTRYLRYFSIYKNMPEKDVVRFTTVDHVDRVALVVVLSGEIIGVGRFDRLPDPAEAEVAFVVADAHQGRGIGSVLLEHLAAAARERGVRRFVAEVLAENQRMVRVFTDAGYQASHQLDYGVVHLTFAIGQTALTEAVAREREHAGEAASIRRLLSPRSVAVVGASTDSSKIGNAVLRNLVRRRFHGDGAAHPPGCGRGRGAAGVRQRPGRPGAAGPGRDRGAGRTRRRDRRTVRDQGRAGADRHFRRLRRTHGRPLAGSGRAAGARRRGARERHARRRAELPGRRQQRSGLLAQRFARSADPAARADRFLQPVRCARGGGAGRGGATRRRAVDVRLGRQPRRRVRQRPVAVLGGRPRDRRRPAVPGEFRQPAQVRPAQPSGGPPQADRGREVGARAGGVRPARHQRRPARQRHRRAVRGLRDHPGTHAGRDVRRRAAAGRAAAAGRGSGRCRRQLGRAEHVGRRRVHRRGPRTWCAPSTSESTLPRPAFGDALRAAAEDEEVEAIVAVFVPPLGRVRSGARPGPARRRARLGQAGAVDVPRLRRGAGRTHGARATCRRPAARCRPTRRRSGRCGRWPGPSGTPDGGAAIRAGCPTFAELDAAPARRLVDHVLATTPAGRELGADEVERGARARTG